VADKRRVDPNRFAMVPQSGVPRSAFDVRFNHKTTFVGGRLIPIFVTEILPGDSLSLRMRAFARLSTLIVPVMDNMYLESWFFFVPNRLVWEQWERFMGAQNDNTDTTAFLVPQISIGTTDAQAGTIFNYLGLRQPSSAAYTVSALPLRAYNAIYNEFFRDEDLDAVAALNPASDGPDTLSNYSLQFRRKRQDYFTTARPWPQKPSMSSLGTAYNAELFQPGGEFYPRSAWNAGDAWGAGAPVSGIGVTSHTAAGGAVSVYETGEREVAYDNYYSDASTDIRIRVSGPGGASSSNYPDVRVLINDLRQANQLQLFMERNARGGTRYTELIRSHFGVVSPDARLQRPEYLGGGRMTFHVNPVAQTSASTVDSAQGGLAGIGSGAGEHGFSQSFTEHGHVIGIVQASADVSYQQGVNRFWFRRTVYDHYFPSTANLGEQAILNRELYATGAAADTEVFGYQERWAEYKWHPNIITGMFQSQVAAPLDVWHLAQEFGSLPTLGSTFLADDPPFERVLQVSLYEEQDVLFDSSFALRWVRCMPMYSIPGLGELRF